MNHSKLFRSFSLVMLAFAFLSGHTAAVAQQDWGANVLMAAQQQQSPAQASLVNHLPDVRTFSGKIIRSGDTLLLQDGVGESTLQIDDQSKAKAFEGEDVRVMGTVDVMTNTARIVKIEREQ
jgi:hypothetical protein